jgi:uncharacterized protein YfaT (DUF1175 family)
VEEGEGRELVCLPYITNTNWLKIIGIVRKIYQFNLKTKMLTAALYRLQNKWDEISDVPIPWDMVYELIQKNKHSIQRLELFNLNDYTKLFQPTEGYKKYMGHTKISAL